MGLTTKELALILLALGIAEDTLTPQGKEACKQLGLKIAECLNEWLD